MNLKRVLIFAAFLLFVVAPLSVYFGRPFLVKRDFDIICARHTEHLQNREDVDRATLVSAVWNDIDNSLVTSTVRKSVMAISMASPQEKYELFSQSAKSFGYSDWSCPAMESFYQQ